MKDSGTILEDQRRIKCLFWEPDGEINADRMGVTEITAYYESGQCAPVTWFAVWKGDHIIGRYNGAMIGGITYFEDVT